MKLIVEKEKEIKEAEGRAEAIRAVQQATADGLRAIKEAGADVLVAGSYIFKNDIRKAVTSLE